MGKCPCGSGKEYSSCCEPYISGRETAQTAEVLMRSRYSAYVKNKISYIETTHDPATRDSLDLDATEEWARESKWQGLEIITAEQGGRNDETGTVEFKATFMQDGEEYVHHELSQFVKKEGRWYFHDGHKPSTTVVREAPKVGRNDPCPCGSGKKYKKCCG